jgi:hypothetical protein
MTDSEIEDRCGQYTNACHETETACKPNSEKNIAAYRVLKKVISFG